MNYTRKRSNAFGRLYSISGGAPNHPLVAFSADAGWFRDDDYWALTPQSLSFARGYSRAGDADDFVAWMREDLDDWRSFTSSRQYAPVLLAVETSQSPHLFRVLQDAFTPDIGIYTIGHRLRTGDISALESEPTYLEGARDVGGTWLTSWFDNAASRAPPTEQLHNRPYDPGRIALTFDQFRSEDAPGLDRARLRSSLSATESLRVKAQREGDFSLALSADESLAAALMLSVLTAHTHPPPSTRYNADDGPWGWNPNRPVTRGLLGVR